MIYLSYLATALVLTAVYYISKPLRRGQYLILCADTCWFVFALSTHNYALAIQSVVLFVIGCFGLRNWKRNNIPL
jgi:hypothetical protein